MSARGAIAPAPPAADSPRRAAVHLDWPRRAAVPAAVQTACTRAKGEPAPGRTAGRAKRCPRLTQTREANMAARQVPRDVHEDARDMARRLMGTKRFLKSRDERKRVEMR